MAEQYANFGTQTLISGLAGTSTATTWLVTTNAGYPAATPFHITIDSEIMVCTASTFSGGTFTMSGSRGQESTVVATHSTGVTVLHAITAGAMDQIRQDLIQTGTLSSATNQKAGDLFFPNNGINILRDTGSQFATFGPVWSLSNPSLQSFVQQDFGTASSDTLNGGITIVNTNTVGAFQTHALVIAAPATPYHVEFGYLAQRSGNTNAQAGVIFSDGTKYELFDTFFQAALGNMVCFYLSNSTTYGGSTPVNINVGSTYGYPFINWVRIGDNGTNKTWDISVDGFYWINVGSETSSTNFTATKVGVAINSGPSFLRLLSCKITG